MKSSNSVAHPLNPKNLCFDAEGTATVLQRTLRVGELLLQSKPTLDVDAEIAEAFIIVANVDKKQWTRPMSWV